ncbi:MAG: limonene-1,2-epoxide hydrolase family protein [Steroidobacteraceae bacterium]
MSANIDTVMRFVQAWNDRDLEAIVTAFAPNAVYHNMPLEPVVGHASIRATIAPWLQASSKIDWKVHHIAETPAGVVLAERTDYLVVNGKQIALPIMGTFELANGLITAWRDYYDANQYQQQLPAG